MRLVKALEEVGGLEGLKGRTDAEEPSIVQAGAVDPSSVRLKIKANRSLSPAEVVELVRAYQAGATQVELARRFGIRRQRVYQHLVRQGVETRLVRTLTDVEEAEAVRRYVEEPWTLAELAAMFNVGQTTIRTMLVRKGVARRPRGRRVGWA